jgi:hypothetical protein
VVRHLLSEVHPHERIFLGTVVVCDCVLEGFALQALSLGAGSVISMDCVFVEAVDCVNQRLVFVAVVVEFESVSHAAFVEGWRSVSRGGRYVRVVFWAEDFEMAMEMTAAFSKILGA